MKKSKIKLVIISAIGIMEIVDLTLSFVFLLLGKYILAMLFILYAIYLTNNKLET